MAESSPFALPPQPELSAEERRALTDQFRSLDDAASLPENWERHVEKRFGIRLESRYGPHAIRNPFGKASGQLSLAVHQVEKDAAAGLGFVVLKTVIAEDAAGGRSMSDWAIRESRMKLERITGAAGADGGEGSAGEEGWTVTWIGRGWPGTLDEYLEFYGKAVETARPAGTLVAPSCKYHLPGPGETEWREQEYEYTTQRLLDIAASSGAAFPMPLEKDFSPTLAGSDRASATGRVLEWLDRVPALIRAAGGDRVAIGVKVFNSMFGVDFQIEMLERLDRAPVRPDFLIYANRLFNPDRVFQGRRGVAYGGPDLSARNLAVLRDWVKRDEAGGPAPLPISATGNLDSGRRAAEYLLRGASSFQMHTLFQLPDSEFAMRRSRNKTERVLHTLVFHPERGFLAWLLHLRRRFDLPPEYDIFQAAGFLRRALARRLQEQSHAH